MMANGLKRSLTQSLKQTPEPSGSSPTTTDGNSFIYSSHSRNLPPGTAFPSGRRGTWPLLYSPSELDTTTKQLPAALESWLTTPEQAERIRMGRPRVETRVLDLRATLDAVLARMPGGHGVGAATGQAALVFDDARGRFAGWRPKVASWCCSEENNGKAGWG